MVGDRLPDGRPPDVRLRPPGLVGRDRELAALRRAGTDAGPALVLVEGEAGVGKSRLLQEFLADPADPADPAGPAGAVGRCLVGSCPPYREPYTLGPVVDAVRYGVDSVRDLPLSGLAGALRPLFPEWAADLPPAPEPLDDVRAAQHRLFRALVELLDELRAAVLAVEDVHWADEATLEFLMFLASRQPLPLSVVLTYRPEDIPADSLLRRLSSRNAPVRVGLDPLDVPGTAEMIRSMLGGGPVSTQFAEFLHGHAGGLPLVIEEAVKLLADRGDLVRRGSGWRRRKLDGLRVPPTVRDAVLERVGRLGPAARSVLDAAAVLAEPADEDLLAAVAGSPADGLAEAVGSGLLRPDGSFRHALAATAVYETIPPARRRAMHLLAGQALQDRRPPPVARLAHHFRVAGDTESWCRYAAAAADRALESGDAMGAAGLLHDLLAHGNLSSETLFRLVEQLPPLAVIRLQTYAAAVRALRTVLDAGRLTADQQARASFLLGRVLILMDDGEAGHEVLAEVIPSLEDRDPVRAARAITLLAIPGVSPASGEEHLRWLLRGERLLPALQPEDRMLADVDRISALLTLGDASGLREAVALLESAGADPAHRAVGVLRLNLGDHAMRWGRYAEARRWLALARALAGRHQYLRIDDLAEVTAAHVDWFTGRWSGLAARVAGLAEAVEVMPLVRLEAALIGHQLAVARGAAPYQEVLDLLGEAWRRGAVGMLAEVAAVLVRLALAGGDPQRGLRDTDKTMRIVAAKGGCELPTELMPVRVAALLAAGRSAEARHLTEWFATVRGDAPLWRAALAQCRAQVDHSGQPAGQGAALGEAAELWQHLPRPYEALLAREQQALCLRAAGQREPAERLLRTVHRDLLVLGATGDAGRVAAALGEPAVDLATEPAHPGRRGYGDQLSPRELEVATLVVAGLTNREIATSLSRSPKTVEGQLHSAMRKLGVASRTALAVAAVETGLVTAEAPED